MARENVMRQLLRGFQTSYLQGAEAFYDKQIDEENFAREQEAARIEQKIADQEEEVAAQLYAKESKQIRSLLSGKVNGRDLTDQEKITIASNLSEKGVDRYEQLKTISRQGNRYLQAGRSIYEMKDGVLNPIPVATAPTDKPLKRLIGTKYGKHATTGQPGWAVGYDDGTSEFFPSPLEDTSNGDEPKSIWDFDDIKFAKFLNPFTNSLEGMGKDLAEYRKLAYSEYDPFGNMARIRNDINTIAFNNEQTLYHVMPPDTRWVVDDWYSQIKKDAESRGTTLAKYVHNNQDLLRDNFLSAIVEKKKKGELNNNQIRLLSLWIKFKLGYLIESKEKENAEKARKKD